VDARLKTRVPIVKNVQAPRHAEKLIALLRGGEYFPEVRVIQENWYTVFNKIGIPFSI